MDAIVEIRVEEVMLVSNTAYTVYLNDVTTKARISIDPEFSDWVDLRLSFSSLGVV